MYDYIRFLISFYKEDQRYNHGDGMSLLLAAHCVAPSCVIHKQINDRTVNWYQFIAGTVCLCLDIISRVFCL